ncbi:WD40 repeat domain-containing protein [Capilliphycus salinus ALCB114379]
MTTLEGHSSSIRSVAFSPDSCTLASGSNDKTIKLWRSR